MQVTIDTEALAGVVGAVCGAAGAAITLALRMARPVRRHMDRFRLFLEDWDGEPARYDGAVPERPGMMKRMAAVEAEFKPNGGQSMRDQVNLIGARQIQHDQLHAGTNGSMAT